MQIIIYKKRHLVYNLIVFYLLTVSTFSYSQDNFSFDKIEIYNINEIDRTSLLISHDSIIKNINENVYTLEIEYVEEFYRFINIFFLTKEFPIYKRFERADGYRYSENDTLIIVINYKCNKTDVFSVELAKSDFIIETTDEFNKFLRLIYGGYKIKWKKIDSTNESDS